MASIFYLVNGINGNGNKVNLLSNGKITSNFKDISMLDLSTIDIDFNNKNEILKEYNNDILDKGLYYDLSYPHTNNETKVYAPIFNYGDNKIIKDYTDSLRYFAEKRKYKVENKKGKALEEDKALEDYIYKSLGYIMRNHINRVTNYDSNIAAKLKEIIDEKFKEKSYMGVDNYINSRIYVIRNILSSYTQLRYLTLEIIRSEFNKHIITRSDLDRIKRWDKDLEANPIKEEEYKQLTLHDLYPDLVPLNNPKTLKKKR